MPRPKKTSRAFPPPTPPTAPSCATIADITGGGIIKDTADNYEEVSLIGTGAYGTVYKAKDLLNEGQFVALKKVPVPMTEDGVPLGTLREIALLKHVDAFEHPNVVRLLDICHGPRLEQEQQLILYLVMEHCDQDLATYLQSCPRPGLPHDKIKDIAYQILNGVDFLHTNRIVHRDLKPQNILITNTGNVKVADFGLARLLNELQTITPVVVTLWYRSPEVLLQNGYASAVDIWSIGCIIAEMYRNKPLFRGQSEIDQLRKIFEILGCPEEEDWPTDVSLPWITFRNYKKRLLESNVPEIGSEGLDLLKKMFTFAPSQRICAKDAMNHEYFRNIERQLPKYKAKKLRKSVTSTDTEPGVSSSVAKK